MDTLKLIYTQEEAFELVSECEKPLKERIEELEKENKKLKEFNTKRKESMFYFKSQMERAEPKTAREAEDLQKAKEIFEKLYRQELSYLEEENKILKDSFMRSYFMYMNIPAKSNTEAIYKWLNYEWRYKEIKNKIREEIMRWE